MDFLKGLFQTPTMIRVATDKLRSLFTDDGLHTIVLKLNPHNLQPPLPGFDVLMFKESVATISETQYAQIMETIKENPYAISVKENSEFEALKNFFKAAAANYAEAFGGASILDAMTDADNCPFLISLADRISLEALLPDPVKLSENADNPTF